MLRIFVKTFSMTIICFLAFIANPMAFPFVLVTGFGLWCLPYAISALRAPAADRDDTR